MAAPFKRAFIKIANCNFITRLDIASSSHHQSKVTVGKCRLSVGDATMVARALKAVQS